MTNELARRLEALEKRMNAELSDLPPGGGFDLAALASVGGAPGATTGGLGGASKVWTCQDILTTVACGLLTPGRCFA